MKWSLEGKLIAGGLGTAMLLMGIDSIISYQNAIKLSQSVGKVKHTHEVLNNLTDIFATLTDAESAQQNYVLFQDESELKRYKMAIQSIDPKIKMLEQMSADNPDRQRRLAILKPSVAQKLALLEQYTDFFQTSKLATGRVLVARNKRSRNEIRQIVTQMQNQEEQLLKTRIKQSETSIRHKILVEFIDTFLTFVVLLGLYLLLHRQMTKRQQAEIIQRTLAQEKELGELKLRFFSMISHEFRTPLTIILGSAQLLAENSQQWPLKQLKNLNRIQSSAKLMTQLLIDVLTLERAEVGKLEFKPEIVDLESFCLNLVEDIQSGGETQHPIRFVSLGQCTHAKLDERLLYSIISNLLSNALKYSPQGEEIHFTLSCEPEMVTFQIEDKGIGISLEDRQALYEPFRRGENVGKIVGTGLGLAVVKKCLELHQGQILVESELGVGTTFTVKIPLQ